MVSKRVGNAQRAKLSGAVVASASRALKFEATTLDERRPKLQQLPWHARLVLIVTFHALEPAGLAGYAAGEGLMGVCDWSVDAAAVLFGALNRHREQERPRIRAHERGPIRGHTQTWH